MSSSSWADIYLESQNIRNVPEILFSFETAIQNDYLPEITSSRLKNKQKEMRSFMSKEKIRNSKDFVKWIADIFDPNNELHVVMTQELITYFYLKNKL